MKVTPAAMFRTPVRFFGPPSALSELNGTAMDAATGEKLSPGPGPSTAVFTTRAYKRDLTANEIMRARQVQSDATHAFTIRYSRVVTTRHKVAWQDARGNHIADISGIRETVPGRELEITATETNAGDVDWEEVWQ